jgi:hypothetical protein
VHVPAASKDLHPLFLMMMLWVDMPKTRSKRHATNRKVDLMRKRRLILIIKIGIFTLFEKFSVKTSVL